MATTNLGRVSIVPKGEWNSATSYAKLDIVTYEGSSYLALQNNTNKVVTDTDYWQLVAEKGEQGDVNISQLNNEEFARVYGDTNLQNQINGLASGSPLVASSVSGMIDTNRIYVNSTDGHWYYYNGSAWTDGGVYQSTGVNTDKSLTILNGIADSKRVGDKLNHVKLYTNKADISTLDTGYYYASAAGKIVKASGTNVGVIDRIYVKANVKYHIRQLQNGWFWLGDEDNNIISKLNAWSNYTEVTRGNYKYYTFVPLVDCYLYCTIQTNLSYDRFMVTEDFLPFDSYDYDEVYAVKIDDEFLIPFIEELEIGDFYSNIKDAVSGIAADGNLLNDNYQVNIILPDGTYEITTEIELPNYVNLIGKTGNREDCVINYVPVNPTNQYIETYSAFRLTQNNIIKNVTITCINGRYVIHDESSNAYKNWYRELDNCAFIHYENELGNWDSQNAYGEGASSGSILKANNCEFITYKQSSYAYSVHNNISFDKPMKHYFDNCKFISYKGGAFRCEGLASGTDDEVFINASTFKGPIYLTNALSIKCHVSASNLVQTNSTNYFAENSNALYREYTDLLLNNSGNTIPAGSLVCYNNSNDSIKIMTVNDDASKIAGYTIGDTLANEYATVITAGYYRYIDILTYGTEFGVDNGRPSVSAENKIGYATGGGFIKLSKRGS